MYKIFAKIKNEKSTWEEDFNVESNDKEDIEKYIQAILIHYNSTLKPGETKRELVEILFDKIVNLDSEDESEEPGYDPECSASEKEREESGIECEFENRDGSWWCTSHNTWA